MGNPQFKTVDDAAEWVASFLLSISCPEQEAAAAKDCIIRERIDPEILASMSMEEIRKEMRLTFGDAKKLEKAWIGNVCGC